ncbi:DUF3375 domain-containing protein [Ghiorsea bivora]|uniref:DUF3375 domain-containing protein n=1 Tax=Ghiorsea bivora TaxID=1485545 RepID=UPI000571FE0D|nr:DUF3375 domain-containing protein [Ghiorsea bivora]
MLESQALTHEVLESLSKSHPAWRLLRADSAPLVISFLHRIFIVPNLRDIAQSDLQEALEDELFALRERLGTDCYPRQGLEYLNDWADNAQGWLRKFYPPNSDEPHYDLTPATEKGIRWLAGLTERHFIGTESRLLTLFDLLQQIADGSETDPKRRIAELRKKRRDIDNEIKQIQAGELSLLDETALKDRFQQFVMMANELLSDFREVEQNFRTLDRRVRERIVLWEGGKGELLQDILNACDDISDSDQGKSFRAFWDFLMSSSRQEELTALLDKVMALPPIAESKPNTRLRRVHYDWLEAGEHTQRTVAQLSGQLRRFLDDKAWLENKRIIEILHHIKSNAREITHQPPKNWNMNMDDVKLDIVLPMERPLYQPPLQAVITSLSLEMGDEDTDAEALFSQVVVDKNHLKHTLAQALLQQSQVSLAELLQTHPLQHGLAELMVWLQIASEQPRCMIDEQKSEKVQWRTIQGLVKQATLPHVLFVR